MSEISIEFETNEIYEALMQCSEKLPNLFKNEYIPVLISKLSYVEAVCTGCPKKVEFS